MQALSLVSDIELNFNLEFYDRTPHRSEAKVGTVEIVSRSHESNREISEYLGKWLTENGWMGLVRVDTEVDRTHGTSYGFNEAKISFVPGEFQSNELRLFHAEIPFDLADLREELNLWLTKVGTLSQQKKKPAGLGGLLEEK